MSSGASGGAAVAVGPLFAALCQGAQGALEGPSDPDGAVEEALTWMAARGQAAWPSLPLPPAQVAAQLGATLGPLPSSAGLLPLVESLHAEDFHLATACALGVPGAASAFDRELGGKLPGWLARLRLDEALLDDLRQGLAERLLLAPAGLRPRIAGYSGRSPLGAWVRVIATRLALDERRRRRRRNEAPVDGRDRADEPAAPQSEPELALARREHAREFAACLREAVASLPVGQRQVLRLHLVEGLGIDAIGARYQVHRATAARWIAAARDAVHDETRRLFGGRLGLDEREFESLAGDLRSRLDLSLGGLLAGPERGEPEAG